jgi:hypothetical protein
VPLVGLFFHLDLWPVLAGLALVLALGNLGFAALATLFAAIAARTRAREVMLPLLLLPLLVPLLIGSVEATRAVLAGGLAAARDGLTVSPRSTSSSRWPAGSSSRMLSGTEMRRWLPWSVCVLDARRALARVHGRADRARDGDRAAHLLLPRRVGAGRVLGFFLVAAASAVYLWNGSRTADRLAQAAGEVGVLFCTLVLVSGPLWARPIWGVWWTWDPRLTMTVILWAIYASYLMLRAFGGEDEAVRRYARVLGIVGVLDIPLIKVSVRLLRGIHPAVIVRNEGGSG